MSQVVEAAVQALNGKLDGGGFDGAVKFVIEGEGAIRIDADGAAADDGEADCTVTASAETFEALLAGDLDPTAAFMSGKLAIEGDMGQALKLGSLLG